MQPQLHIPLWLKICLPILVAWVIGFSVEPRRIEAELASSERAREQHLFLEEARHLVRIAAWQPWRSELLERAAQLAFQGADYDLAIQLFLMSQQASTLAPSEMRNLGEAYFQKGNFDSALSVWEELIQRGEAESAVFDRATQLAWKLGKIDQASRIALSWAQFYPKIGQALYTAGLLTFILDPFSARKFLTQANSADPALTSRLDVLLAAIQVSQSQPHIGYQKVILGRALASLGYWDLAKVAFLEATRLTPDYAEGWAFLGEARQQSGEDGFLDLEKARAIDPKSVLTQALISLFYRRQGKPEEALRLLKAVALTEPKQAVWLVELGNTMIELKDMPAALQYYQNAAQVEPENPHYWGLLAEFCAVQQFALRDVGLQAARQALVLAPEDVIALDVMGQVMQGLDDGSSAERFFLQALERSPVFSAAQLHLGQLYLQENRMPEAQNRLKLAIQSAEGNSAVQLIASRLLNRYFGE